MTDPIYEDRITAFEPEVQRDLVRTIRRLFASEDEVLRYVREHTVALGLPEIHIRPEEGQMLQFLAQAVRARRVVEVGTLAGYSGIWLARALPWDGQLITLELNPRHAQIAREHFALAGVTDRVTIRIGEAGDSLQKLASEGPFDMMFLDADKTGYPDYLDWAVQNIRPGGVIAAHNAFRGGALVRGEPNADTRAMLAFLEALAANDRLAGTILPVGDGIAAAIVR